MMPRIRLQLQNSSAATTLYEVSERQRYNTLYVGTEGFVTSSIPEKRVSISKESRPIRTQILNTAAEEVEFRTSRMIQWVTSIKSFPITVRTYGFPEGSVFHPKTGIIAKHSETLLQGI